MTGGTARDRADERAAFRPECSPCHGERSGYFAVRAAVTAVRSAALAISVRWAVRIKYPGQGKASDCVSVLNAMREAVHLLRPADGDRDPARPVPCRGIVGHVDDRETAQVLLGLDVGPVKTKTPASVISSSRASPALPLSRSSSSVSSGAHSSLKAIRYRAISGSSATGSPDGCRSPSPRTDSPRSDTSGRNCFQAFRIEVGRTLRERRLPSAACVRSTDDHPGEQRKLAGIAGNV